MKSLDNLFVLDILICKYSDSTLLKPSDDSESKKDASNINDSGQKKISGKAWGVLVRLFHITSNIVTFICSNSES